jgi:hypothetical protein
VNVYKQRGTYDCFLACVATALQRDYEGLWPEDFRQRIEAAKGCHGDTIDEALSIAGLNKNTDYWCLYIPNAWSNEILLRRFFNGRRALLQVPSLNHQNGQHIVCWMGETLYDPSNKQVYQWIDQCTPAYVWIFNEVEAKCEHKRQKWMLDMSSGTCQDGGAALGEQGG